MWSKIDNGRTKCLPRTAKTWESKHGHGRMVFSVLVIAINPAKRECAFAQHVTDEQRDESDWFDEAGDYKLDFEPTHFIEVPY